MAVGNISIWQIAAILLLIISPIILFAPIARKAGYSGWWSLLMIIPVVNLVMIWVFAFAKWPVEDA